MISVSRVYLPHDHQPRSLACAAAAGSPAHVPSTVGDHEGMSKPSSSSIQFCTSGEPATRSHSLSAHRYNKSNSLASGILSWAGQSAALNTTLKAKSMNTTAQTTKKNKQEQRTLSRQRRRTRDRRRRARRISRCDGRRHTRGHTIRYQAERRNAIRARRDGHHRRRNRHRRARRRPRPRPHRPGRRLRRTSGRGGGSGGGVGGDGSGGSGRRGGWGCGRRGRRWWWSTVGDTSRWCTCGGGSGGGRCLPFDREMVMATLLLFGFSSDAASVEQRRCRQEKSG